MDGESAEHLLLQYQYVVLLFVCPTQEVEGNCAILRVYVVGRKILNGSEDRRDDWRRRRKRQDEGGGRNKEAKSRSEAPDDKRGAFLV